ncbi:MAG: hypothetical protein H0W15_02585 [Gemmatimonadales bacterium]|nr:hypothetical protein [Gemmatimonadales bacterium]
MPEVQSVDLDEKAATIRVGVIQGTPHAMVREALEGMGVPSHAVTVVDEVPVVLFASVRDRNRTFIESGFQIAFPVDIYGGWKTCTSGADVFHNGLYGFVTAGHCSQFEANGVNSSTAIYQNNFTSGDYIGYEYIDTPFFSCNGGANTCRYSDAMYVRYSPNNSSTFYAGKKIAETSPVGTTGSGGLNVARYRLSAGNSNMTIGLVVRKTGRTSGTTEGTVSATCVDKVPSAGKILLCQDVVDGWSRPGDSGAPVYWPDGFDFSNLNAKVYHAGILWGGDTINAKIFVSPWSGITTDLGVWY